MRFLFHPAAEAEFDEAVEYYELCQHKADGVDAKDVDHHGEGRLKFSVYLV
jgi:hypothetical protein